MAAAKQNATIAAWVYVLDQYELPANAQVAPEDFWGTYESFYCNDLIDEDQYYNDETAEKIRAGRRSVLPRQVHDALGRLRSMRTPKGVDMSTKPSDLFAADDNQALVPTSSPLNGVGLAHHSGHNHDSAAALFANSSSTGQSLFQPEPAPVDMFLESTPQLRELGPSQGAPSALACTNIDNQPFDMKLTISVTCSCSGVPRPISVIKEDARGLLESAEYVSAEESGEEYDKGEFVLHGRCDLCQTTVCASAVKPVLPGTMGRSR